MQFKEVKEIPEALIGGRGVNRGVLRNDLDQFMSMNVKHALIIAEEGGVYIY